MAILGPAFAFFALTAIVMLRLARLRFAAVAAGRVDPRFYKIFRGDGEPGPRVARLGTRGLQGFAQHYSLEHKPCAMALSSVRPELARPDRRLNRRASP